MDEMDPDVRREYEKALKEGYDSGLIKIHFTLDIEDGPGGESVWATPIGKKYAKIQNIPFFVEDVSIDDIVEIQQMEDTIPEFVRLVTRATCRVFYKYNVDEVYETTVKNYGELAEYLKSNEGRSESATPGFAIAAFPLSKTQEEIVQIMQKAPHVNYFEIDEDYMDDE